MAAVARGAEQGRAAVLALLLVVALVCGLPLAPEGAAPGRLGGHATSGAGQPLAPAPGYPVRVTIGSVTPAVPRAEDTLTVGGTLANTSDRHISGARMAVRVGAGGVLRTRGDLAVVAGRGPLGTADGAEVRPAEDGTRRLGPGGTARFRVRVPVEALRLGAPGAYALTVGLTDGGGTVRGLARTFLPWYPQKHAQPLKTTVLWPLTDVPHMQALAVGSGGTARPVFRDDVLTRSLASGGRLRRLVELGRGKPVAWVIDPDLIAQVRAMADGYRVAGTRDTNRPRDSAPGRGGEVAADWLAELRGAVRGREVLVLPYADLDLASVAHLGTALAALGRSGRRNAELVGEALGTEVRGGVAWPVGGALDDTITALAGRLGLGTALASGEGLTTVQDTSGATDNRPVALAGGLTALTYDTTLAALLDRPPGMAATDRQRLLAETLTAVEERPSMRRRLVVVPPRALSASRARTLVGALREWERAGWLEFDRSGADLVGATAGAADGQVLPPTGAVAEARTDELVSRSAPARPQGWTDDPADSPAEETPGSADRPVDGTVGPVRAYPPALRATEAPARHLAAVTRDQRRLRRLAGVLSDATTTTGAVRAALARSLSTAWRGQRTGQHAYQRGVTGFLTASMASVRLVPKSTVTVAGNSAVIPVTVENALQQAVHGVEVRVTTSRRERLSVDDGSMAVRVSRTASRTVRVAVTAHANGPVRLTARLYTTSDGRPWGEPVAFTADVRSVSSGAVAIVAGGVSLVVLAALIQLRRARRREIR